MTAKRSSRPGKAAAIAGIVLLLISGTASAASKGVIAMANNYCMLINTTTGYVLVAGTTTAAPGTVVLGRFRQQGVTRIVNSEGLDISENPYIFSLGLTREEVKTKWKTNCTIYDKPATYVDPSDRR